MKQEPPENSLLPAGAAADDPQEKPSLFVHVPKEKLAEIQTLYDRGLYLQAYRLSAPCGPLQRWSGPEGRTLAGRLATNLGGYRLAEVQHWLAWRSDKMNPDLVAYHASTVLRRRGPLAALNLLERNGNALEQGTQDGTMHWATIRAIVLAHLRDFPASDEWLEKAAAAGADHPWLWTTRAHVFELQDRYAESLEAAEHALKLRPDYRPGIQAFAHGLQLLDRDEEALELLIEACGRLESMHLCRQLAALQAERSRYEEAAATLDRLEALAPLMERAERRWLQGRRVTLHCLRQDWPAARAAAREINEPYYSELAARLEREGPRHQVRLDVPFVRQHHLTCSPATLSAISRFWRHPAEHLEVAEAICYDGTPSHSERHWAETHGWAVREFTVSWEAAVGLLDRGVPFMLTTQWATGGHQQAVVGYDQARETLWIRDPFVYYTSEFAIHSLLEDQRATGPRGMAFVPADRAELLEGLDLPEAALHDRLYAVDRALAEHRREEAVQLGQAMQAAAPDHRLTLNARCAIANYDSNTPALLESIELLLKQFPESAPLQLAKLSCLRDLARRTERLQLLEQLCEQGGTDPVFWQSYAQELRCDARQHEVAAGWVRWALRYRPAEPALVKAWADILWDERQFTQASRLYRIAACLGDRNEGFAQSFFLAGMHLRQTEEALQFLRARERRLGQRAAYPAITLVESLQHVRRTGEAVAALEAAMARRSEDDTLFLFAADFYARLSRFETAEKLMQTVQTRCAPLAWHRTAASVAGYQSQKGEALAHWREVLKLEPLAYNAVEAAARLIAETESRPAALRFLDEQCARFPYSCPLLRLRIHWLSEDGTGAVIPHLRKLLEVNPADGWAWRELALAQSYSGQVNEALEAAEEAIRLEPNVSTGYSVRGAIQARAGRVGEGRKDYREALRLEVDNSFALQQFVDTAPSLAERTQALEVVAEELRRQIIFDDALFAYQSAARGLLLPRDVLSLLQDAHRARPDLWQAWSVLIHQLVDVGDYEQAFKVAQEATERFPLLPPLWLDLARVEQARLNDSGQIAAFRKALELDPNFAYASRQLAEIYERQHNLPEARATLEQAIVANPLDAFNHGCLAQVLWLLGEREAAIKRAQHALQLQPGYDWARSALLNWGEQVNRPSLAADTARELTRLRPGEARSWLMLARSLDPKTGADELFAALDKALALNAGCEEAYDLRAQALSRLNRFEEALAQCHPPSLQPPPALLLLRAAWLEAERGNLNKAMAAAKAMLAEHPDHYGGWQLLSDWHLHSGHLEEAAEAAEKMAALAPLEAVPLGYLGDLKLRLNDRKAAEAAFERAFTLDPAYTFAGFRLFTLQVEAADTDKAARTLEVLRRRGETHETLACSVELELARQNTGTALELFENLCVREDVGPGSLETAVQALKRYNQEGAAKAAIGKRLAALDCLPAVAEYWVDSQARSGRWWLQGLLASLPTEARRRAVLVYLDDIGTACNDARRRRDVTASLGLRFHLWRLLRKHREWLRQDLEGWGKVGYVLTCADRPQSAVDWLADWRSRPAAESWMLYNLMLMLHKLGRYTEALAVIRAAATQRHGEGYYEELRLRGAFEEALAGDMARAKEHLANLSTEVSDHLRPLRSMTELLLALLQHPPADNRQARQQIRAGLIKAFPTKPPSKCDRYVRSGYRRLVKAMAARKGRLGIWPWWFYHGRFCSS